MSSVAYAFQVITHPASGPQTRYLVVSGSITATGALSTVITTGFIAKSGSITPTGEITEFTIAKQDSLAGVITPTGSLVVDRPLTNIFDSGEINPTGELILQPNKKLAGSITPTGFFRIASNYVTMAGSITPTGAVVNAKAGGQGDLGYFVRIIYRRRD